MTSDARSIAIIGGGFSGTLMAIHLLRRVAGTQRVYLFEKSPPLGRGVAYNTGSHSHLLNVRAGGMSAFEEEPLGFVAWLNGLSASEVAPLERPLLPDAFVPRRIYGSYLQHCLQEVLSKTYKGRHLYLVTDEVVDIAQTPDGLCIEVWGGRRFDVDRAVLAIGNLPPSRSVPPHYVGDPWSDAATRNLDPGAEVLLLGTGLTMVDTALSLTDRGHKGTIHAISRRGLLPRTHITERDASPWQIETPLPATSLGLLRAIRAEVERAAGHGRPWQDVFQALRPQIQTIWQLLPFSEQQAFLRHLRPWWDVHRHRIPPQSAARINELIDSGQLRVRAARVEERKVLTNGVEVTIRNRGTPDRETLSVARAIDCSGPKADYAACVLVRNLLIRGEARSDPLGLGIDVDDDCSILDRQGRPSDRLSAVGPLTRGAFWEITGVPEIRRQCAALARNLVPRPIPAEKELHLIRAL